MGIAADLVLVVLAGLAGGLVAHRLGQPLLGTSEERIAGRELIARAFAGSAGP